MHEPIPHMQDFFEAIDIVTSFTGREVYYMASVDKVYMPDISGIMEQAHQIRLDSYSTFI
ncbi:hypothetical protein [Rhodophyticola sp.]|jgi:antirestriction protein ArdC|uniref:hypothetical protein n=1 Tax=Rhodophyticola sp. TaxID=2680032 RepID=UPI003D2D40A5